MQKSFVSLTNISYNLGDIFWLLYMKRLLQFILIFPFLFPIALYAQISDENKLIFERFNVALERRYDASQQEVLYKRLISQIDILLTRNLESSRKKRLEDIAKLSHEQLYKREIIGDNNNNSQKELELRIRNSWDRISWFVPYSQLQEEFQYFITEKRKFVEFWSVWEGIYFSDYLYFENQYGVRENDLSANALLRNTSPLYRDDSGRYNFVRDFEKRTVLKEDIFFGLPEKFKLMEYIYDDMRFPSTNLEQTLREIQEITKNITTWKSKSQKIEAIYEYILENVSYSQDFQLTDMYIYSWIEAFKRGSAVCTGYVKLMAYMLAFAGINDFEVIRWYVIDADDFPQIWHAWIRIGEKYYDPTFDDPIGALSTLTSDQYIYYALPKDIMYTNRFEYGSLPEEFRTMSMDNRREYIINALWNLYTEKYKNNTSVYKIFDEIVFRDTLSIWFNTPFTVSLIISKIPYIDVNWEAYRYTENGMQVQINRLNFYTLTDANISALLRQIQYNLSDYTLIKWNNSNGTHEWRFGFNIERR